MTKNDSYFIQSSLYGEALGI